MDRRDFLKVASVASLLNLGINAYSSPQNPLSKTSNKPSVLFLVFDTYSALHSSLFGYPRNTSPELEKFADLCTVYHNHYSTANFTAPGTASLLTGTFPSTHRALIPHSTSLVGGSEENIFKWFKDAGYYTLAMSQNNLVNELIFDYINSIDEWDFPNSLKYQYYGLSENLLRSDYRASKTFELGYLGKQNIRNRNKEEGASMVLGPLLFWLKSSQFNRTNQAISESFPYGLIGNGQYEYYLEDIIDYQISRIGSSPKPFFYYSHYLPPHSPYNSRVEFTELFKRDNYRPTEKPPHPVLVNARRNQNAVREQLRYNQHIAYSDAEFGRIFNFLTENGYLDNTWVIFTSDHGEMFERGQIGHMTNLLHQGVIRVPLLIHAPGQTNRIDVNSRTSSMDVLPTILSQLGLETPTWLEGEILPPYTERNVSKNRPFFAIDGRSNNVRGKLNIVTLVLIKGSYKLHYYKNYNWVKSGYPEEYFELYNLETDPEELNNLAEIELSIKNDMLEELLDSVDLNAIG